MKRLRFDSQGKLDIYSIDRVQEGEEEISINGNGGEEKHELRRSDSLAFLNEHKFANIIDNSTWSLYSDGKKLEPLRFSNGKTQEDVTNEVVNLIRQGNRMIFIHGVCGTGKSAIALNIARQLGKASIVVPVKALHRQYEEDYMGKKYVYKPSGQVMKIAMITGRDNHDSIINPGVSCADPSLPDTIAITEKNFQKIKEYYDDNPLVSKSSKHGIDLKKLKRIAIAPANPYWSPILPAGVVVSIPDARKKKYRGLQGKDFVFYHRQQGCSYFDQYQSYIDADTIIFNSAKYKIEVALDRKPETNVDIIDEADEFLDSFSTQKELNITRLINSLISLRVDNLETRDTIKGIIEILELEERQKKALGVDEKLVFKLSETIMHKVLTALLRNQDLEAEVFMDENSYVNDAFETARDFFSFLDETYVTYRKKDSDLIAGLVTTNLSKRLQELADKTKVLVFMSGTLHSEEVLKDVFGVKDYKIVEAETLTQGNVEVHRTGREFDCKYSNFKTQAHSRHDYVEALSACLDKAKKPILIHVNAFEDLPSELEKSSFNINNLMSREKLYELQKNDKTGRLVSMFKSKLSDALFTTKCSRGVDFPGDVCNSVVFTKYPNPNVQGTFWKILQKTHPHAYWEFYRDKARREFLQRIYRAVRSKEDHVYVLSPDSRVLDAVRE
ncbi:MAG: helicase C-terminal domain-containing protein, partial [archaeon]